MAVALEVAKVRRGDMPRGEEEHRPGDEGLAAKPRKGIMGSEGWVWAGWTPRVGSDEGILNGYLLCFQ